MKNGPMTLEQQSMQQQQMAMQAAQAQQQQQASPLQAEVIISSVENGIILTVRQPSAAGGAPQNVLVFNNPADMLCKICECCNIPMSSLMEAMQMCQEKCSGDAPEAPSECCTEESLTDNCN